MSETGQVMSMDDAIKTTMNGVSPQISAPVHETPTVTEPATVTEPVTPEKKEPSLPVVDPNAPIATAEIVEIKEPKAETPAFDEVAWLKEKFGPEYVDIDSIKSKLVAPKPFIPEFANEQSKKIYDALIAGETKPLKDYLDRQEIVFSAKDKTPAEKVKTQWKLEYGLTDAEVEYDFSKRFVADELMEDMDRAIFEKKAARELIKLSADADKFFEQYATPLTLPSFEIPAAPASAPMPNFSSEEAKQALSFAAELNKNIPGDVSIIPFELSENDFNLKGQVSIPKEPVEKIKAQFAGHEDAFIIDRWFTPDGEIKADLFARDVYLLSNYNALVNAAVSQTYHKTLIGKIKEDRNYQEVGKVVEGQFDQTPEEQRRAEYRRTWM